MIELNNVTFEYGSSEGAAGGVGETISNGSLKNINLKINEGEFVLLTGGSGCGKTTILRLIKALFQTFLKESSKARLLWMVLMLVMPNFMILQKVLVLFFRIPVLSFLMLILQVSLPLPAKIRGWKKARSCNELTGSFLNCILSP